MSLIAPTRTLIVGSGGREHALAWKLASEPGGNEVIVAPGSDAIAAEPRVRCLAGLDPLDPEAIVAAARREAVELVVIGPEGPLAVGVTDALVAAGIPTFGPSAAAARIETSKSFCHEIAAAAGVPMARAHSFTGDQLTAALGFLDELDAAGSGIVLKADGLAAGKGVIVCETSTEARDLLPAFLVRRPGGAPAMVVEARLNGPEASVIALCDGERAIALPAARDHKRLCDGDRGPNTGGMGAYSPLPDLDDHAVERILTTIHRPILAELARRGTPFRGFLYAGLILTADGPVLLECNARLGDPEAQVVLPLLGGALGPWLRAAAVGSLPVDGEDRLVTLPGASVGVVLAARGYPGTPKRGHPIDGIDRAIAGGALVFHGGTIRRPNGAYGTNGGRVMTVVGIGRDLTAARVAAEAGATAISWDGLQRRHDIALAAPMTAAVA